MSNVTRILNAIERGDAKAADELLPIVYEQLRLLASQKLSQEKPGQTLQATALVHEAYIRLVEGEDQRWNSRGHFFKAAAEAMRRILVESVRRKRSVKHGGEHKRMRDIDIASLPGDLNIAPDDLISLDEALGKLGSEDQMLADLVKLHCFTGLPLVQVADILGMSHRTTERHWAFARAWLNKEIFGDG
ncbi:MAG: sigma-70 family RNA polymerase sigma factor [Phycisphaerales bacterium]|nr:MAG: sigma-70 family RNA polymerase sigma factor [Phycisphaerales bacterium]